MKKILFVASEAVPYASSGGLGDVIGSLPAAIKKEAGDDVDIRVILPLYGVMEKKYRDKLVLECEITVSLAWRRQYCGIHSLKDKGITYYFLDNEYYFKRPSLYGSFDDGERYAFFCKAAMESLRYIDFFPDVLHAHDWQTALTVIYLKRKYGLLDGYRDIKSVFTIHNIAYQGVYGFEILGDVFDLSPFDTEIVEYSGAVNLMKGAIICADRVTTVSPTYAKEIMSAKFSSGLHYVLELYKGKLSGILNGIDKDYYNPSKDEELFVNYSYRSIEKKAQNKEELQKMLSLNVSPNTPVVAVISRLTAHKGLDLIQLAAEDILENDVQLVILGTGDFHYENFFYHLAERYRGKVATVLRFDKDLAKKIYSGADMFLMPSKSEPCGLAQMIASRYGTVPIVRETGGLYDSIKDYGWAEGGNGFTFAPYSAWELLGAVRRACEVYGDSEKWKALVKKVMLVDFSWKRSAVEYIELYKKLF